MRVLATMALFGAAHLAGGCLASQGEPCAVDSDCADNLVCSLAGECTTFGAVQDSFVFRFDISGGADTTTTSDTVAQGDTAGCAAPQGVFAVATPPCADPASKRVVTGIEIADMGNGLAPLAAVANNVLASGFEDGNISLELWVDGTLAAGCQPVLAWIRSAEDITADCTPVFPGDVMPLEIPALVSTQIEQAVFDPVTNRVTGLVDKAALLASLDEALRDVADQLIITDVDTDGDMVPDHASAIVTLSF